ncbi:MAG TPA: bleomycin hydrolase [Buttiauxella sp.]
MNQQEINDEFEKIIRSKSYWSRFVGSQFVTGFSLFVGQIYYRVIQALERGLMEAFISTATRRSSILAAAADRSYVPRPITPSTGRARIVNKSDRRLQLPVYSPLISNSQLVYVTMTSIDVNVGEDAVFTVSQMDREEASKFVDTEKDWLEVILPKDVTAECFKVTVYVSIGGEKTEWEKSTQFRSANSTTKCYTEFYKPTEQIGFRFGDGVTGMRPPEGSTIILDIWRTKGETTLVEGQKLTPIDELATIASVVNIATIEPITGGAPAETTEETRQRAQYMTAYDEQIVWGGDYAYFINTKIGGITFLRVWGESEQEKAMGVVDLRNINRIFISAHKPGVTQEQMEAMVYSELETIPDKLNKHFSYMPINPLPFTIEFAGKVSANDVPEDIVIALKAKLEERFGINSTKLENRILLKDIWTFIDGLKLVMEFEFEAIGLTPGNQLNDFVYLDTENSTVEITYSKGAS